MRMKEKRGLKEKEDKHVNGGRGVIEKRVELESDGQRVMIDIRLGEK